MAFRNYYPKPCAIENSTEVLEKTLCRTYADDGTEVVEVVQTPIPSDLPSYETTSLDALQSAGVVVEKVSPYVLDPDINMSAPNSNSNSEPNN